MTTLSGHQAWSNSTWAAGQPRRNIAMLGSRGGKRRAAAPLLRLAPGVRPQTRLELALCALFRCRPTWPAGALVDRLALAPVGSALGMATLDGSAPDADAPLGRAAAQHLLDDWLARGLLAELTPAASAPSTAQLGGTEPLMQQDPQLPPHAGERVRATRLSLSLDWWAVIAASATAVLVGLHVVPQIPW